MKINALPSPSLLHYTIYSGLHVVLDDAEVVRAQGQVLSVLVTTQVHNRAADLHLDVPLPRQEHAVCAQKGHPSGGARAELDDPRVGGHEQGVLHVAALHGDEHVDVGHQSDLRQRGHAEGRNERHVGQAADAANSALHRLDEGTEVVEGSSVDVAAAVHVHPRPRRQVLRAVVRRRETHLIEDKRADRPGHGPAPACGVPRAHTLAVAACEDEPLEGDAVDGAAVRRVDDEGVLAQRVLDGNSRKRGVVRTRRPVEVVLKHHAVRARQFGSLQREKHGVERPERVVEAMPNVVVAERWHIHGGARVVGDIAAIVGGSDASVLEGTLAIVPQRVSPTPVLRL
eukprot:PhM_4_TR18680/c0_g1_i1/m.46307